MLELQCSVSKIEQFRKYIHEAYNGFIKNEDVIKSIKGEQVYKPAMVFGTAYHALIEGVEQGVMQDAAGYVVKTSDMPESVFISHGLATHAAQYRAKYPAMTHEVNISKVYHGPGFRMLVKGRVDGLNVLDIHDAKTTERNPSYDDWFETYQWRLYLDMLNTKKFFYDFFVLHKKGGEVDRIKTITIPFSTYPEITDDCMKLITYYVEFCKVHGLMEYLQVKEKTSATHVS